MKKLYMLPLTNEKELILKTVFKEGPDKVCLICPKQKKNYRAASDKIIINVGKKIIPKLKEFVDVDQLEFRFDDYNVMMKQIVEYIKKNKDEYDITVNISQGYHLICALMLNIASIYKIKVQYTYMTELNPRFLTEEDWHFGFQKVVDLPTIPTNVNLSKKETKFLEFVNSKKSVIVQDYVNIYSKSMENRRRSEFNYYVDKFEKQGIIKTIKVAARNISSLTETGELILTIHN